jgi:hypothetical protein
MAIRIFAAESMIYRVMRQIKAPGRNQTRRER